MSKGQWRLRVPSAHTSEPSTACLHIFGLDSSQQIAAYHGIEGLGFFGSRELMTPDSKPVGRSLNPANSGKGHTNNVPIRLCPVPQDTRTRAYTSTVNPRSGIPLGSSAAHALGVPRCEMTARERKQSQMKLCRAGVSFDGSCMLLWRVRRFVKCSNCINSRVTT